MIRYLSMICLAALSAVALAQDVTMLQIPNNIKNTSVDVETSNICQGGVPTNRTSHTDSKMASTVIGRSRDSGIQECPPWFNPVYQNDSISDCVCGDELGGIVDCETHSNYKFYQTHLLHCYCMGQIVKEDNVTVLAVGHCLFGCFMHRGHYRLPDTDSQQELNKILHCSKFNRTGSFCGKCDNGFAPPVYSYSAACADCTDYNKYNWIKYSVIAFGPLTVFLIVVLVFRVSLTSPPWAAFVLVSQTFALPEQMRVFAGLEINNPTLIKSILSFYGIFNLDFFRGMYSPICIHPNISTLQAIAMDYIIAVYPLLMIVITYILVSLHDQKYRLIVWLWKPFSWCFSYFRRQWDIRGSLINAFATFLILSYVKLLSVSFSLLAFTQLHTQNGSVSSERYLYYDATVQVLSKQHVPYAALAILVLLTFILFPLLLLCLYPCRCFQRALNFCRLRCFALYALMDAFQGYYKDGTNNTWDCRYFAGVYLLLRISMYVIYAGTLTAFYYPAATILLIILIASIAVVQPYKHTMYNGLDVLLLLSLTFGYTAFTANIVSIMLRAVKIIRITILIVVICALAPIMYISIHFFYWIFAVKKLPCKAWHKYVKGYNLMRSSSEDSFANFLDNREHNAPLVAEPVTDSKEPQSMATDRSMHTYA